ncbi:hypothetical protein AJ80_05975 [Polytolypa hystricis UAMH7299]|uniref:Conidiation-specific protein 6 n=1 Tax=Polytolypa hystricis (strain UAMH7299) TaxID=1447883 RepID=A0A2B7XZM3_POLH7|nr:hypothetical protein AJ80_05975 [Polytolypa hystricis UAMH7299]
MEDRSNQARGYKAAISNPNVSDEAKQHAQKVLDTEFSGGNVSVTDEGGKDPGNVARGLKASITNPNVSDNAKEEAKERLEDMAPEE